MFFLFSISWLTSEFQEWWLNSYSTNHSSISMESEIVDGFFIWKMENSHYSLMMISLENSIHAKSFRYEMDLSLANCDKLTDNALLFLIWNGMCFTQKRDKLDNKSEKFCESNMSETLTHHKNFYRYSSDVKAFILNGWEKKGIRKKLKVIYLYFLLWTPLAYDFLFSISIKKVIFSATFW